ncbi:hypothetical protein ANANG_G00161840 [Anguilla anguilla]|uniref:SH3 domain-containing protein n=1 Tax=Anguilla anguilla TaxID=7936 RepID=A0A9D3MBQ0_ANGAN|nr:hypothetical protein ANANG_G00161840 [Anguilla anguilla]
MSHGSPHTWGPFPARAAAAHGPAPGRADRSPGTRHRELPTISAKSGSTSSTPKSDSKHLTPKSESLPHSPRKSSPTHEVDTASEVEELDIDVSPIPYPGSRVAAKLQVFIARYSYNPYDGPNDNPEVELPLTAGEYIYVYGDMDDDGFYEGELMDGRRGLVPSNFVERVSDDDMMSLHPPEAGELSHGSFQDSSLHSEKHLRFSLSSSGRAEPPAPDRAPAPLANGLDLDAEEAGLDSVPYPRKLTLIKQLAKSIIIGWDPPLVPAGWGNVWGYNVFVDEELRLNVPFGAQTKAVLERLDVGLRSYRVSVQSLTDRGGSDRLRCSLLVGRDVSVAPTGLRADCERELVKAGSYSLCLSNLEPNKQYRVKVEARPHRTPWELPLERREHKSATTSFTTLMAGPPDAPLDVQLDLGPTPGIALISWLPVTIDAAGTSNGVRVTGYTIFADKNKVLEVSSPTAGSALLGPSQIHVLKSASELTVRTMSPHGESVDSAPIKVQPRLLAITTGPAHSAPRGSSAGAPKAEPSYAEAWADPSVSVGDVPVITHEVSVASQPRSQLTVSVAMSSGTDEALESHKDPDSPGARRPAVSLSEFLEEPVSSTEPSAPSPSPHSPLPPPPPRPLPPPPPRPLPTSSHRLLPGPSHRSPGHPCRGLPEPAGHPPAAAGPPLPAGVGDGGRQRAERPAGVHRGVPGPQRRRLREETPGLRGGSGGALSEYQAESSRGSDLSDILEEEEEDLYSDPAGEERSRGYGAGGAAVRETLGSEDPQLAEAAAAAATAAWYGQSSPKQGRAEATQPKDGQLEAEPERLVADGEVRIFVALFPYDPAVMSPNPDAAEEELPFKEGQIIKVHGEKDADGFYRGECGGRLGYVPCNMVSEIQVDDEGTRDQLLQQGFLSAEASMEKIVESAGVWEDSVDSSREGPIGSFALVDRFQPACRRTSVPRPRRMVAIFDYDPRESSPNADVEAELKFSAGDVIYVFGDMDDDGFFYGEVNGQKGLVPSNFLQALPESGAEAAGGPVGDQGTSESRRESQASLTVSEDPPAPSIAAEEESPQLPSRPSTSPPPPPSESPTQTDASPPGKKKKGFFSKGRKLLKKLGSSKKD